MPEKGGKQNGSGVFEGLWTGTAIFAALKARNFTGFLKSYAWYALILIVGLGVAFFIAKSLGLVSIEKFGGQFNYPPCPKVINGPSPQGDQKCTTEAGDVRIY